MNYMYVKKNLTTTHMLSLVFCLETNILILQSYNSKIQFNDIKSYEQKIDLKTNKQTNKSLYPLEWDDINNMHFDS